MQDINHSKANNLFVSINKIHHIRKITSVQYILVSVKNQDTPTIHIKQPKN